MNKEKSTFEILNSIDVSKSVEVKGKLKYLSWADAWTMAARKFPNITYSVIKSGLVGLTKYLATYWPEQNVRCNVVCPGGVKSGQSREFLEKVSNLIPLNRLANKNEFNSTIVYLLSDSSQYVNGAIISIDGGRTIW